MIVAFETAGETACPTLSCWINRLRSRWGRRFRFARLRSSGRVLVEPTDVSQMALLRADTGWDRRCQRGGTGSPLQRRCRIQVRREGVECGDRRICGAAKADKECLWAVRRCNAAAMRAFV